MLRFAYATRRRAAYSLGADHLAWVVTAVSPVTALFGLTKVISEQPGAQGGQSARYQGGGGGGGKGGGGDYIKKVTNDAREDEMDENLGYVPVPACCRLTLVPCASS